MEQTIAAPIFNQIPCPPLPTDLQISFEGKQLTDSWVDHYVEDALSIAPATPRIFHENAALSIVSVLVARRLNVQLPHARIYPNLFSIWLAPTTLWNKSTALNIARQNLRLVAPHLLAPQDTTLEALLADLAGLEPANLASLSDEERECWQAERNFAAQRGLIIDEMSGLLSGAGRDYNAGLLETHLRLYDCDELFVRSTRGQGRLTIHSAYFTLLGASTPAAMAPHIATERLWATGYWPRFAVLTPEQDSPVWRSSISRTAVTGLMETPLRLYNRLPAAVYPQPPATLDVSVDAAALQIWHSYDKAMRHDLLTPDLPERLWGWYGRAPTQVMKVSTELAALDWGAGGVPKIEMPHVVRAIAIVETWRASVHRVLALTTQSTYSVMRQKIVHVLAAAGPHGATLRDFYKMWRDKSPSEIEAVLEQMMRVNEVIATDVKPGPQGGRPTRRYRLATD